MKVEDLEKLRDMKDAGIYQRPLLATVFYVLGVFSLLGGIVAAVLMESGMNRLYTALAAFSSATWLFGIGQILDIVGRAAHHAGRAADQQALILHEIRQLIQRIQ